MSEPKEIAAEETESKQRVKKDSNEGEAHAEGRQMPWYKNVSTLISFMALLLSFGTTYFAYTRAQAQNVQNIKTELRSLLQRLSSLPQEYEEGMGKNRGDHNVETAVNATISHQNSLLSSHAAELARSLPRSSVSATEWYSIAMGLQADLKYDEAKELLGYALESAKGLNEKVAVLRATGNLLFRMGKPREGRDTYNAALAVFSDFAGYDDRTKNETQLQTHLSWADSAAYIGLPDEATEQIARAKKYWEKLPKDRHTEDIRSIVIGAERNLTPKAPPVKEPKLIAKAVVNPPRPTRVKPGSNRRSEANHSKRRNKAKRVCY